MSNRKLRTFISDDELSPAQALARAFGDTMKPPRVSPPAPIYASPGEVPLPPKQTIKQAYDSGLTVAHTALVFELPDEWVEMFVRGDAPTN